MANLAAFKADVRDDLKRGREAFVGKYAAEITGLMGLSREEIDAITPDGVDLEIYDQLISVVKQASRHNVSQAQLVTNIRSLGSIAVTIAKKVGRLAKLFA